MIISVSGHKITLKCSCGGIVM